MSNLLLSLVFFSTANAAAPSGMIDVTTVAPTVVLGMSYATPENFMGYAFYTGSDAGTCWLTPAVADKVAEAEAALSKQGYHLLIYDCARPVQYQYAMWDSCVANHGASHCGGLVANPYDRPSGHTYGKVIDVGLVSADGTPIELPSKFDSGLFPGDTKTDKFRPRPPSGSVSGQWTTPSTWTKPTLWGDAAMTHFVIMATALHDAGLSGAISSEWWHWKG